MNHYFTNNEQLKHEIKRYDVKINDVSFVFETDAGTFSRNRLDYGTGFLLETINILDKQKIITDMGCGYGPIGIYLAKLNPESKIYMYDVNERAITLARKNCEINNVINTSIKVSNLFEKVEMKSDIILTNPPIRAGKKIVFELYESSYEHLNLGGELYVVIQKKQGAESSINKLHEIFSNCEVMDKRKGYFIIRSVKAK